MLINKDRSGIHIHASHKELAIAVLICFILIVSVVGILLFRYYYLNHYDSSLNGSEVKEFKQNFVPPDVKKRLGQKESLDKKFTITSTVQIATIPAMLKVPILMYHYVENIQDKNDKKRISLNTPPYILEQEIKTLSEAGYTFMTNAELADALNGKTTLPAKPIVLTFDDGYRDLYTDVFPILKKYRVKATAYLISGFLNRNNHLLESQVTEIIQSGLVEIGAHTVHHIWLKGSSLKNLSNEIFQSKVMLEQTFHISVVSFAYPFGAFDLQSIEIVKKSGFKSAASTIPGIDQNQDNKFFLYRLRPGGRMGQALLDWLENLK